MWPRIGLAILTLIIYGSAVLSLHQDRRSGWDVEKDFSLAAAVSYSVYGTPLGMTKANVYQVFRNISRSDNRISVQEAMARTAAGDLPAGDVLKTSTDGIGASYPIFASLAMRLFGPHLSSLTYSFLLLMVISTLAFIFRFRDDRLFMVPLLFFALTLMLLSPLATNPEVMDQGPIGGYRYFTVAGILPALHILFELTDRSRPGAKAAISNFVLLGLQVLIFAFVMLVRGSAGYILGPIVLAAFFGIWANWRTPTGLRQILGKIGFTVVAGMAFFSILAASVPDYVKTGRFFGVTWGRAIVGFGLHPDWPFGNLREVYNCTNVIPQGLVRGTGRTGDDNQHCVFWSSYPSALPGTPTYKEIDTHLYDGVYEKGLRSAFFNVVRSYPRQVFELYAYYKSAMIVETLRNSVHFDLSAQTALILALAVLQCGVFVVFVVSGAYRGASEITPKAAGIVLALFVFSLLPLYFAWGSLHTSIDTIFFMYAGVAIVFGGLVQATIEQIFRIPKSDMSTLLSITTPNNVRVGAVLVIGAGVAWGSYNYFVPDDMKTAASPAAQPPSQVGPTTQATNISELPPLPESSSTPARWDLIDGLSVKEVEGSSVVSRILRLVAVGADGRHALGARFGGLNPGGVYRASAWVKAKPGVRTMVMIEARDGHIPGTEKPSNYGVAQFDLAARTILKSTGDILASGVEVADGWVKLWVDLRSKDGEVFVLIGLLGGTNNQPVFKAAGQEVTFGGFEISPPQLTNISELQPLPESSSAPGKWDLIDGLSAEEVEGSAVVSGQRILRLVAVGADGRHALGARYSGLAPGEVYRAFAWVKAKPGVYVMIEARDGHIPGTENPSNYGVARFNLAAHTIVNSTGDILASGVDAAAGDWVKLWVDLRSKDGQIFVLIGLLEGLNNKHVFNAAGQEVTFGGFEISPR
jgi:hypothetical protein